MADIEVVKFSAAMLFIAMATVQVFLYLFVFLRVGFKGKRQEDTKISEPVSIIICAKNEEENLKKFLVSVLEQDYPIFEVIVVNDNSADESFLFLSAMKEKYPCLKVSAIYKEPILTQGKKLAQTVGIKAAKYDLLLFTDADCRVESKEWIRSMVSNYSSGVDIVLGYGGYIRRKGFLDKIIRHDTCFIAMQYLGFAKAGMPYMGVGRNLSYRKKIFFENKGFASHSTMNSGDDDLFINEVARKKNTRIEISPESHTRSEQEKTFGKWLSQKQRHLSTSGRYRFKHRFMLGLEVFSKESLLPLMLYLVFVDFYPYHALIVYGFRLLVYLVIFKIAMWRLKERDLLLYSPFLDIAMPFVFLYLSIRNFYIKKRNRWS